MPYRTPEALRAALTDRIATAAAVHGGFTSSQLRRQFAYDRLLTRIFTSGSSNWILKGAGGLLARIPGYARHSLDIDLFHQGQIVIAIAELQRLGADDTFGDYFTFDMTTKRLRAADATNTGLSVVAYLGEREFERFTIDLVVESNMTAAPEAVDPINPVHVPGLPVTTYRVYPLVDHIADKHAAMLETHNGHESTRYRDLVDLVVIASTQRVDAKALRTALLSEYAHRGLPTPSEISLPSDAWIAGYEQAATTAPNVTHTTAAGGLAVVAKMLNPILGGRQAGSWNPSTQAWDG